MILVWKPDNTINHRPHRHHYRREITTPTTTTCGTRAAVSTTIVGSLQVPPLPSAPRHHRISSNNNNRLYHQCTAPPTPSELHRRGPSSPLQDAYRSEAAWPPPLHINIQVVVVVVWISILPPMDPCLRPQPPHHHYLPKREILMHIHHHFNISTSTFRLVPAPQPPQGEVHPPPPCRWSLGAGALSPPMIGTIETHPWHGHRGSRVVVLHRAGR